MANYNTFVICESRHSKIIMVTSSARKARSMLTKGYRVEVWNDNIKNCVVTKKTEDKLLPFVKMEKEYIAKRQEKATEKNLRRRMYEGKYMENKNKECVRSSRDV